MARIPRLLVRGEPAVYHVISRTALDGFVLGDVEKEYMVQLIRRLSAVYFSELLGFCVMGNHVHLLVRMHTGEDVSDDEIRRRFRLYYGPEDQRVLADGQLPSLREKWSNLSEYVREIKQGFSRWYNKRHGRKGFFWGERFKSVLVDEGDTLVNCLAYIDLNPVRAGLVVRPEDYRWCSLGYHLQAGNAGGLLSTDFGLRAFGEMDDAERLGYYRKFVYQVGSTPSDQGARIAEAVVQSEERKNFELSAVERFRHRTRYFTDSGVIGTKEFVSACYRRFAHHFTCRHEKKPQRIGGLDGVYSLKRLRAVP